MSEKVAIFESELADILLGSAGQGEQQIASQPVDLLAEIFCEINSFNRYNRSLADCEAVTIGRKREFVKDDGFCRVMMKGVNGNKGACRTLYEKQVTYLLRNQIGFGGTYDVMLRSEREMLCQELLSQVCL